MPCPLPGALDKSAGGAQSDGLVAHPSMRARFAARACPSPIFGVAALRRKWEGLRGSVLLACKESVASPRPLAHLRGRALLGGATVAPRPPALRVIGDGASRAGQGGPMKGAARGPTTIRGRRRRRPHPRRAHDPIWVIRANGPRPAWLLGHPAPVRSQPSVPRQRLAFSRWGAVLAFVAVADAAHGFGIAEEDTGLPGTFLLTAFAARAARRWGVGGSWVDTGRWGGARAVSTAGRVLFRRVGRACVGARLPSTKFCVL
jgi:hypothetical protein